MMIYRRRWREVHVEGKDRRDDLEDATAHGAGRDELSYALAFLLVEKKAYPRG